MQPICILLVLASLTLAPFAAAAEPVSGEPIAWRWALAHAASHAHVGAHAEGAIACALGDADGDSSPDLVLRIVNEAGAHLTALAGPDHTRVLWTMAVDASARLDCAPDVAGDGIADLLVKTVGSAASDVPEGAPVSSESALSKLRALDGATGSALVALEADESASGGSAGAAAGSMRTDVTLQPAGPGLFLFVATEESEASASLPLQDFLLSSGDANVRIEILDASGELQGVIESPEASEIFAHAGVVDTTGARVLVLSATEASPIDQVPAQVPTLAAHATDGSLLWSTELDATTGAIAMLPRAGDINGDGVQDVIVESMPSDLSLDGASALTVLSGADGSVLLARATAGGFLGALPLGDLTPDAAGDADALLVLVQERAGAPITLECVRQGASCWTTQLPANAWPVNGATDAFTGDLQGFHDLTGDGVPDVAAMLAGEAGGSLQLVSGVDGSTVWSTAVNAKAKVEAIAGAPSAGADLAVLEHAEGAHEMVLTMLDGADGSVRWSIAGEISHDISAPDVQLDAADGAQGQVDSLILSVADAGAAPDAATAPTEHVYLLDPATGATRWAGATAGGAPAPPELMLEGSEATDRGVAGVPGPAAAIVVAAIGAAAGLMRRPRGRSKP